MFEEKVNPQAIETLGDFFIDEFRIGLCQVAFLDSK